MAPRNASVPAPRQPSAGSRHGRGAERAPVPREGPAKVTRRLSGQDGPRTVFVTTAFDLDAYVHAALTAGRPASS
ncbi:hypothetical protein ACWFQ8_11910 [Streptomyces sp. NPDC055254]